MSQEDPEISTILSALILILMIVVTFVTIIGNSLVILAWTFDRRFRSPQNAYLFSLSIVDFLIGILLLPADIALSLKSPWVTNPTICKLRFVTAVFLYLLSVFHLAAIAVDRYRIIAEGVQYIQERGRNHVAEIVIYLYIISGWIVTHPVIEWENIHYWPNLDKKGVCNLSNSKGWRLRVGLALSFPCVVVLVMYWKTFRKIKNMLRSKNHQGQAVPLQLPSTNGTQSTSATFEREAKLATDERFSRPKPHLINCFKRRDPQNFVPEDLENSDGGNSVSRSVAEEIGNIPHSSEFPSAPLSTGTKVQFSYKKERRAAKTLGIIIGAYILSTIPTVLYVAIFSFYRISGLHTQKMYSILVFLQHAHSGINPIIYAWKNEDFKRALQKMYVKMKKVFRRDNFY